MPGPRMLVARDAIGATGGHCDQTGFPPGTFGPESGPDKGIIHGADEARQAVRLNVKYGANVIKMCASGGVLSLARRRRRAAADRRGARGDRGRGASAGAQDRGARARRSRGAGRGQGRHRLDRARLLPDRRDARAHEGEGDLPRSDAPRGGVDAAERPTSSRPRSRPRPRAALAGALRHVPPGVEERRQDRVRNGRGRFAARDLGPGVRADGRPRDEPRRGPAGRRGRRRRISSASPTGSARSRRARRRTSSRSRATRSPTSTRPKRSSS